MPFLLRHAKIICVSLALFKTNTYLCSAITMIVNYPEEHRSLLNVFDWAFFYAHKDIGGCHLVQFIKALRVETSLL